MHIDVIFDMDSVVVINLFQIRNFFNTGNLPEREPISDNIIMVDKFCLILPIELDNVKYILTLLH